MGRHSTFNADRFLDKFQGREPLIRGYVGIWGGRLELDGAKLDVPRFTILSRVLSEMSSRAN